MGLLNINNGVSQEKGITYTVIIDDISNDFGDVSNNTYFLDKQTQLVYYKNSTGDLVSIYEQGGSDITSSAGNGLTYNTTTGQIDLGGDIGIDPDPTKNDLYFTPVSHGIYINYGLTPDGYASTFTSSGLVETYRIDTIRTHTFAGYENMIGPFNNGNHLPGNPAREGVWEKQGSITYVKSYQNLTPSFDSNSKYVTGFTGDGITHYISESLNSTYRTIFDTHTGTTQPLTQSKSTHVLDNFTWEVSNEDTVDPTIQRTSSAYLLRTTFGATIPNSDGTKMGLFFISSDNLNLMTGDNYGLTTVPNQVIIGKMDGSSLWIATGSDDTKYVEASTNKKGIRYTGFGETDEDTGVDSDYTTLVGTSLVPKKYVDDSILDVHTIYNADDSLTDNRIVDLGGYNLTFQKLSSTDEYTKIYRNGGLEVRGSGFDTGNDVFKVKYRVSGNDLLSVGQNGGVTIDSSISMGQFNATWNYGQRFSDGYISFLNGANWNDNEQIRFDLRNNTNPTLTFNRNAQGTAGSRFIVRNSTLYEANYGTSKEQISLQGNTLIKGDSGLERTPYNFKIVNSSGDNTFVSNDDKSIEVYGRTKLLSKEHGILFNRVDSSEMYAISAEPDEVVYNTQLNALYRWDDGLSVWIALAAGYGPISLTDSAGNPTFYADLPSAFSVASSGDVINLHTNITVTSTCFIPDVVGASITLNGNGHTITHESNTGSEFILIDRQAAYSKIYLNDIKIISNGSGVTNTQAVFSHSTIYANNNTFITATNNNCCYISHIDGGNWESTNNHVVFSGSIKNAVVKFKYSRSPFVNCDITIASGGILSAGGNAGGDLINCIITGESTTASSMIVANDQNKIHGCKITCNGGSNSAIQYNTGSYATYRHVNPVPFQDNLVYHYGTGGYAVKATYTAVFKDSYIFSKNTQCMYILNVTEVGGYNLENITLETDAIDERAFYGVTSGDLKMKNVTATNLNPLNTEVAMQIGVRTEHELYMENCTANVNNPTVGNINISDYAWGGNLITTGGAYIYGLIMSKIGTGLNLNTVPLLNSNTADDYGNLKIG
tara:strand:- start:4894 stop:8058 length:3165 start_codon:yes stop_codon:yes gene_type:complete